MTFVINGRAIGPRQPPYIVAELSANHGGSLERALALVDAVAEAGADAIKLQTYRADTMTLDSDRPEFRIEGGLWSGETLYSLYEKAQTPWEWHAPLIERARKAGIALFSTPFDATAVDFLLDLDTPCFKVASFELVDIPLIEKVGSAGKPIIMSTGMATVSEIDDAVSTARRAGANDICLLHCVSSYPAAVEDMNLTTIPDLAKRYGCLVGLSDHSLGTVASIAATALGACLIEKHVTFDRQGGGVDDSFSLEPSELKTLVDETRAVHAALGAVAYARGEDETGNRRFRRSLYVVKPLRAGELLTADAVRSVRPANGLAPKYLKDVLGRSVTRDVSAGEALSFDFLEGPVGR
jgi:N-acetylneuraminate synthase